MPAKYRSLFGRIFKDKHGKIVLWQSPNIPLWGWIIFTVLGMMFKQGTLHSGLHQLASASLFTWAYLEIHSGESLFRRILGAAVMAATIHGFFRI